MDAQVKQAAAVDRARRTAHVELVPRACAGTTRMMAHTARRSPWNRSPPVSPGELRNRFRQALTTVPPGESNSAEALCPWGIQSVSQQRTRPLGAIASNLTAQPQPNRRRRPPVALPAGVKRARPAAPATRPAEIVGGASGGGGRAEVTGPVSNMPTYRAQPWGSRMRKGF